MRRDTLKAGAIAAALLTPWGQVATAEATRLTVIDARPAGSQPDVCCLSGADALPGGGLAIVSDRGALFWADVSSERRALILTRSDPMELSDGSPMPRHREDAEGVAVTPAGEFFVSFEGVHRVAQYEGARGLSSVAAPGTISLARNGGLEALAVDAEGTLWAIPETATRGAFPLLTLSGVTWRVAGQLPASNGYLPVGADFDAGGALYVLERKFSYLRFQSRVRRVTLTGNAVRDVETVWESARGEFDNLEAVVVLDGPPETRLLLISDDNNLPVQETQAILLHLSAQD